ncbi:MAG: DUF86 domain-containing protein [Acidobacteria bacterium]|nr:DUF86 domain-containing protein [Acidobacteriota bacterium]
MRLETKKNLHDVLQASNLILGFIRGVSLDSYSANAMLRSAVERQFEIIGEAIYRLARSDEETARRIPEYRRMIAFRNVLIHGYDGISDEIVWDIVESKVPGLRSVVEGLLGMSE